MEPVKETSEWAASSFIQPKKDGRVRFLTDFRELNKRIKRRPWPMPHIVDLIQDIGNYKFVTAVDLSMGYYHFRLSERLSRMCTFMLPWGMYRYKRLPMGLKISPDFFQQKMNELFGDLPFVIAYLDDIAIFSDGTYEDHLAKLDIVLQRLEDHGLQVNGRKSHWAVEEVEYLGFILTPKGVRPQPKKIRAIQAMQPPKNRRQLRSLIGLVNYYRYMWKRRSHIMEPLTRLTGKRKFVWTEEQQIAFNELKRAISAEVLLSFPDYNKPFHLHTDASDYQLGAVLSQEGKPIAFFSRKLTGAQRNYSAGEKEMLSVVETLKEFRNIVYGYPVVVHTDHRNWTHESVSYSNKRIMRWRLAIEEFMPTIKYVPGVANVVADALSRVPTDEQVSDESFSVDECFDLPREYFESPINFRLIHREQEKDSEIRKLQEEVPQRFSQMFEDVGHKEGEDPVITLKSPTDSKERILVPKTLQGKLLQWYHTMLVHPGVTRLYNTLHQHFTWKSMRSDIQKYLKTCHQCQLGKRGGKGYGKLPLKDVEKAPWADICVDLAGPWKAKVDGKDVEFHSLTIIDPFTSWVEIIPILNKTGLHIADLVEQEWFRRYPRPGRVIFDQGSEFDNSIFRARLRKWYIKPEPITVKNPQANAVVERLHKIMGDMLRVQLVTKHSHDDPLRDLLSAAAYGVRATVHGTTMCTPGQLVFSKDMILRSNMEANIELVKRRRLAAIVQNNERENKRRVAYKYQPGGYIVILTNRMDPKLQLNRGPYRIVSYNPANGVLRIKRGNYVEPIHSRLVRPYFGRPSGGD
jgi:transposase InsO family protein